ncbi:MAG: tetratricopeptide repeat protein [Oligoflexales bacterium]
MTNRIFHRLFMLLCLLYQMDSYADNLYEAEEAYKQGNFSSASEKFLDAEIEEPDNMQHAYNRSVSQYQNKEYEAAASGFAKSAKSRDPGLARNSQFNLGNTLAAKGDLKGAKEAFSELLKQSPDDQDAKENLAWVEKMIQEMEKQKQNQDKQDQENKDQNKQDQENKDQNKQDQENKDQNKQDQENKDQNKQDQENKDQENNDQDKQDQENKDQDKQDQENNDQDKQDQSDKKETEEQDQENESAQQDNTNQQEQEKQSAQDQTNQEILDKADAERLLRSLEDQERYYGKPPKIPPPNRRPIKDW